MAASASTKVKYLGYLYTDMKDGGRPGMEQVKLAHDLLLKKNQKKVRELHPLFARGFDALLTMEISDKGMYLSLPASESKSKEEECLMNQPLHKIAFVAAIGIKLYLVMKRTGGAGKYRCHGFILESEATATEYTKTISRLTNEVFARLRHVTRLLEAQKKKKSGPPELATRVQIKDEDQPWFHGKMGRKDAEKLLLDNNMTNGLFLVRQSERSATDYALTFCYNKKVYHNRIMKTSDGFKNTKNTSWPSIGLMVHAYQTPHEDMQTVITEYVSNKPQTGNDGGAMYMNVALVAAQAKKKQEGNLKRWDTADIQSALSEIGEIDEPIAEAAEDGDIAYDAVYDDVRFGFGADFIKETLGAVRGGIQPKPEYDLDAMVFSCGDIDGEADC